MKNGASVFYRFMETSRQYIYSPSTTKPRVPSLPMNNFVKSGPAEDFLALERVLMTSPLASTIVRLSTFSRIVPYLTAEEYLQEQMKRWLSASWQDDSAGCLFPSV